MNTRRIGRIPGAPKGTCRHCRKTVQPPRLRWCSDQCVTDALILKGDPNTVRREVFARDKGVCAECGLDTQQLQGAVGHQWEADHIVPVVEGGGGCGLDGYRTLCLRCHRAATAELAKRRAKARHDVKRQQREAEQLARLAAWTGDRTAG